MILTLGFHIIWVRNYWSWTKPSKAVAPLLYIDASPAFVRFWWMRGLVYFEANDLCGFPRSARGNPAKKLSAARAISVKRDRVTHLIELITLSLSFIKYIFLWRKIAAGTEINSGKSLSRTIDSDSRDTNQKLCCSLHIIYITLHINTRERADAEWVRERMQALRRGTFIDVECWECFVLHLTPIRSAHN